jgi:hypothetical protein
VRAYRLVVAQSQLPASPLHFLDRSDAARYQKILLWPWESLGYFQPLDGPKISLKDLQIRVDAVTLPGIYAAELDWALWRQSGELGFAPFVPGRAFDPGAWRAVSDQDRRDPMLAPKIANAERELDGER